MDISSLFRPHIKNLTPYSSAKMEFSGDAKIFLDANENPYGDQIVNRYPGIIREQLIAYISQYYEVKSSYVDLGLGSCELIDMVVRMFCAPQVDKLLFCPPTFVMYQTVGAINNIETIAVPLNHDFSLDTSEILCAIEKYGDELKIIFLCSPNNPTGNLIKKEDMRKIVEAAKGIVVIDEAYIDFCPEESVISWLNEFKNVIIIRTLSKALGIAGARVGVMIADPQIITAFSAIRMPYNIPNPSLHSGVDLFKNIETIEGRIALLNTQREEMKKFFSSLSVVKKVHTSMTNFLLVEFEEGYAQKVFDLLLQNGVVVRHFKDPQLKNSIRITIGTPEENNSVQEICSNVI